MMKIINLYEEINDIFNLNSMHNNLLIEANLKSLYNKTQDYDRIKKDNAAQKNKKWNGGYIDRGIQLMNKVRYFGLSDDGTLNFKVNSQTNPGKFHYVYVQADLADMTRLYGEAIENNEHLEAKDLNLLLLTDSFRIGCNCQAFLYYAFKYIATINDYEIEPEMRAPKRNNVEQLGALCKHLVAVVKNLYENTKMRTQIINDIENYLRYINGLEYDEFQTEKAKNMISQQKHQVKWRNKPSDYMNDYFARQAKNHPFLDDHDIKHSLKMEVNKYIHKNPDGTVNDFLKDFFGMTIDGMADEMNLPIDSVEEYFDELGFTSKKEKQQRKVAEINKQNNTNNANILNNNRPTEEVEEEVEDEPI